MNSELTPPHRKFRVVRQKGDGECSIVGDLYTLVQAIQVAERLACEELIRILVFNSRGTCVHSTETEQWVSSPLDGCCG